MLSTLLFLAEAAADLALEALAVAAVLVDFLMVLPLLP